MSATAASSLVRSPGTVPVITLRTLTVIIVAAVLVAVGSLLWFPSGPAYWVALAAVVAAVLACVRFAWGRYTGCVDGQLANLDLD